MIQYSFCSQRRIHQSIVITVWFQIETTKHACWLNWAHNSDFARNVFKIAQYLFIFANYFRKLELDDPDSKVVYKIIISQRSHGFAKKQENHAKAATANKFDANLTL